MRGSFARWCAGAIEAANNRSRELAVLKRFEGISAEEAKALGEGTITVSELKTVKAIHAKTMYAPEETVYERVSFPFGTSNNKPRIPRQHKRGTGRRGKEGGREGGREEGENGGRASSRRGCSVRAASSPFCAPWVGGWVVKRGREGDQQEACALFRPFQLKPSSADTRFLPLFFSHHFRTCLRNSRGSYFRWHMENVPLERATQDQRLLR